MSRLSGPGSGAPHGHQKAALRARGAEQPPAGPGASPQKETERAGSSGDAQRRSPGRAPPERAQEATDFLRPAPPLPAPGPPLGVGGALQTSCSQPTQVLFGLKIQISASLSHVGLLATPAALAAAPPRASPAWRFFFLF